MAHKHIVNLPNEKREGLGNLVTPGRAAARTLTRARILLKSPRGDSDETIALALDAGFTTHYPPSTAKVG